MNLDKLKNLSKEQKQQIVLAAMLAVGVVYAMWQFGLQPIMLEQKRTEQKIESLQERRRKEMLLLNAQETTAVEYRKTRDSMRDLMTQNLPPYDNAMGWATELIGTAAAAAGIQETDLAINERGSSAELIGATGQNAPPPLVIEYRVGVEFFANYHTLGRFIAAIERDNPCAHVGLLTVESQTQRDTLGLEVKLECVFPRFSREAFPETADPDAPRPVPPTPESATE